MKCWPAFIPYTYSLLSDCTTRTMPVTIAMHKIQTRMNFRAFDLMMAE